MSLKGPLSTSCEGASSHQHYKREKYLQEIPPLNTRSLDEGPSEVRHETRSVSQYNTQDTKKAIKLADSMMVPLELP